MPRSPNPKEIYAPLKTKSRVEKRMAEGHGLLKAERLEGIGYDAARTEAVDKAAATLWVFLEERSGPKASAAHAKKLQDADFRLDKDGPDAGEWTRNGLRLDSEEGRRKFPALARKGDAQRRMNHLKMILEGSVFIKGTPQDFKIAICTAFEAGVSFAEAEAKRNLGNKPNAVRNPDSNADLNNLLEVAYPKALAKAKTSQPRIKTQDIIDEITPEDLKSIRAKLGRKETPLAHSTMQNKIAQWLKKRRG